MTRVHELLQAVKARRRAAVMGVLNATPNSFYDGGRYPTAEALQTRVAEMQEQGAEVIDIGGESSKPGAPAVAAPEQIERITPALRAARERGALISVDTADPDVAEFALARGALIINDVTCLSHPELARVVAQHGAHLVLSHARGHQSQMEGFSTWPDDAYQDVVREVRAELDAAAEAAEAQGLSRSQLIYDPGLGFSKNALHCFQLMQRLEELLRGDVPWLIGAGRKSFLAAVDGAPAGARLGGTIAASAFASRMGAHLVRVHDVFEVHQALLVENAIARGGRREADA